MAVFQDLPKNSHLNFDLGVALCLAGGDFDGDHVCYGSFRTLEGCKEQPGGGVEV